MSELTNDSPRYHHEVAFALADAIVDAVDVDHIARLMEGRSQEQFDAVVTIWASSEFDARERIYQILNGHTQDSDCTIDPDTNSCTVCGVYHGDPCRECQGRGFHKAGCSRN